MGSKGPYETAHAQDDVNPHIFFSFFFCSKARFRLTRPMCEKVYRFKRYLGGMRVIVVFLFPSRTRTKPSLLVSDF